MDEAIEAHELVKRFKDLEALSGVDFSVHAGELFGFVGPNGAGKTTVINILCTLIPPTSGRAVVAGFDVASQSFQVRQNIGLVFQDQSLDEYLTAKENLEFHAICYNMDSKKIKARTEELMRMVDLWDRKDSLVRTFSGGMKRRLELARGLMHTPVVLFLDEPTIGLDPQTRHTIWQYIAELRETRKLTIFLTTHYLEEAEACDRVAIIDHGRIVALDTPEQLKGSVGGDVVTLQTTDNDLAIKLIEERYKLDVRLVQNNIEFKVQSGGRFIPELLQNLGESVISVGLHRATLEDVFLGYTGHAIRDDDAEARDELIARSRSRRGSRI